LRLNCTATGIGENQDDFFRRIGEL